MANRAALKAKYPAQAVSLLDVKLMCQALGFETLGVKATLNELLATGSPCIIGLDAPAHFSVLLDGTRDEVRLLDGEQATVRVLPRHEIEGRFTGFALLPGPASTDAPQIHVSQYDQYKIFERIGETAEYHFLIQNRGKKPLSIEIAETSCGCTAALLEGAEKRNIVLPMGKSATVDVSYLVQTYSLAQQTVTLHTDDPRHREIYLSIRGQLPQKLTLSPPSLYIDWNNSANLSRTFKVIGPRDTDIEKVWSDLPYLTATAKLDIADDTRSVWQVSVAGFDRTPVGRVEGKIHVLFKDGTQTYLPVHGQVGEDLLPGVQEANALPRAEDDLANEIAVPSPHIQVGRKMLDFTATDMWGKTWTLSDLKERKNILLTFFPKCFTGGCANHLSGLRDHQSEFDAARTQILAISVDPAAGDKGQRAFATQWKFAFPLIPDTTRRLSMLYGAVQNPNQLAGRMSVLIDKSGIIRWISTDVHVATHGADVLAKMHELGLAGNVAN